MKTIVSVVCALVVACTFSVQPALSHETEHHEVTEEILEELRALRDALEPLLSGPQATAFFNSRLAGKTLVFRGNATKLAFTEPGRFYSFGDPDYPGEHGGNYTFRAIDADTVELSFTWDPANDPDAGLQVSRLSFTSHNSGTHVSTYSEAGSRPSRWSGTFELEKTPDSGVSNDGDS